MHRPHDCCFLGRRGSGGLTDDRIQELCFCYLVFVVDDLCPRSPLGTHFIKLGLLEKALPPSDFVAFFGSFFPRLVALFCFSLGWWGSPCRVFPSPLPSGASSLWVGGFPLPCFPGVFPVVLGWGGVRFLFCFFSCLLPLASCIFLRVG